MSLHGLRAGVGLPLTGRYGPLARQAADGLARWATGAGVDLEVVDCGEDARDAGRVARGLAARTEILFGPYGSGATRAVASALRDREVVVWNHGGSAVPHDGSWMIDVLGPATRYWAGLVGVLDAIGANPAEVAILHSSAGFGTDVAGGAVASLVDGGYRPLLVASFSAETAEEQLTAATRAGASVIVGCGRWEDDVALGGWCAGRDLTVGLVACGVAEAANVFGASVDGWFGPCQWLAGELEPHVLGAEADYPAAQAFAAGQLAEQVVAHTGTTSPRAMWDAARTLRLTTLLGPFAVDESGYQTAHRPVIVRWVADPQGLRRRVVVTP